MSNFVSLNVDLFDVGLNTSMKVVHEEVYAFLRGRLAYENKYYFIS